MSSKGLLIVFSAPSGAGKSTLCKVLMQGLPNLTYSISYTTRPPRKGERDGIDYFFVDEPEFKRLVRKKAFAEWALVHGCYYGTPHRQLRQMLDEGKDVVLDIDVQGGLHIRRLYPDAVLIFIMTPSLKILEQRLRARNKDTEQVIRMRLKNARRELKSLTQYDYLVINDDLKRAAAELKAIIAAEHHRVKHISLPKF
jgi:guanylate kinase